jgi:hypothetical protein
MVQISIPFSEETLTQQPHEKQRLELFQQKTLTQNVS